MLVPFMVWYRVGNAYVKDAWCGTSYVVVLSGANVMPTSYLRASISVDQVLRSGAVYLFRGSEIQI